MVTLLKTYPIWLAPSIAHDSTTLVTFKKFYFQPQKRTYEMFSLCVVTNLITLIDNLWSCCNYPLNLCPFNNNGIIRYCRALLDIKSFNLILNLLLLYDTSYTYVVKIINKCINLLYFIIWLQSTRKLQLNIWVKQW